MSEKLLRGHGDPYRSVITVDRLTAVPYTRDGMNHCTLASEMLAVSHCFMSAVYVSQPFMSVTMQTTNPLSLVAYLGDINL